MSIQDHFPIEKDKEFDNREVNPSDKEIGPCYICEKPLFRADRYTKDFINIDGKYEEVVTHNTCRFENPDVFQPKSVQN